MISRLEAKALDINATYHGVSAEQMMERAGKAIAEEALRRFNVRGRRVLVVCGPGNNGGDGLVAARHLCAESEIAVHLLKRTAPGTLGAKHLDSLGGRAKVTEGALPQMKGYALIIDALLGIGAAGEPRGEFGKCIDAMNSSGSPLLSADIPSGMGTAKAVRPLATVTFHEVKEGMARSNSGEIIVADIGIPPAAIAETGPGEFAFFPIPDPDSHKGLNGRVLVVGGGPYTGAPALAGMAALRMGADLAYVAAPEVAVPAISSFSPDIIARALQGSVLNTRSVPECGKLAKGADALLIGPGLGKAPETMEAVRDIVRRTDIPMVIDADAFSALAGNLAVLRGKRGILTPHKGEFQAVYGKVDGNGIEEWRGRAASLARATGMTVLLKGRIDIVTDGARSKQNRTGNAAMTVGGTGDVLAGLCAGLMAKGVAPFEAARLAAFTNGLAGDMAFERLSYGMVASDLLSAIPEVLRANLPKKK